MESVFLSFIKYEDLRELYHIIICWIIALLWSPFTLTILTGFRIYKNWIGFKLKKDKSSGFKCFLSGEDVLWTLENPVSKFVINVLAYVPDSERYDQSEKLLHSLRERVYSKLMVNRPFPKLFYLRKDFEGFHYWTDDNPLTVRDYIRYLECIDSEKSKACSENTFLNKISEICNQPLPANNKSEFEMLVGRQPIQTSDGRKYPILFRFHHSLGDGIAIVRLLLENLCDENSKYDLKLQENPRKPDTTLGKLLGGIIELITKILSEDFRVFVKHLVLSPSVIHKLDAREADKNGIHPNQLSGRKIISWYHEPHDCTEKPLISEIKLIKRNVPGSKFTNILLAALSKSLTKYMKNQGLKVPNYLSVVTPSRIHSKEKEHLELSNKFSIGYRTLPLSENFNGKYSQILMNKPDYSINYWMMTSIASVFPQKYLEPLLVSKHCTMAVSNIPGPNFTVKINNFELGDIGFFLPNIGQTGLAVSILSYNNRLNLGILADENALPKEKDLEEILHEMVAEIRRMATDFSG